MRAYRIRHFEKLARRALLLMGRVFVVVDVDEQVSSVWLS